MIEAFCESHNCEWQKDLQRGVCRCPGCKYNAKHFYIWLLEEGYKIGAPNTRQTETNGHSVV